jgi:hypothetical protein
MQNVVIIEGGRWWGSYTPPRHLLPSRTDLIQMFTNDIYTVRKRLAIFPSAARMSLNQTLPGREKR